MADVSKLVSGSIVADYTLATLKRKYYLLPLLDGEEEYEIPKPDGWTGLGRKFVRDKTYHGFVFEGAEDTSIRLHELEGASYVLGFYNIYGTDFRIRFQEKVTSGSTTVVEWDGIIDLNKLKVYKTDDSYYIEVGVIRNGIEDLIKPRFDTKINLTDVKTIDESTLVPPNKKVIALHSQAVTYKYLNEKKDLQIRVNQSLLSNLSTYYIKMDTQNPTTAEIEEYYQNDLGVIDSIDVTKLFYTKNGGSYLFDLSTEFSFSLTLERRLITTPIDIGDWTMDFYLAIDGIEYPFTKDAGLVYSGTENDQTLSDKNFKFSYYGTHTVNPNSSIYIYGKFVFDPSRNNWKGSSWTLTNFNTVYNVEATTTALSSRTYAYSPKDCLEQVLNSISDNKISLSSTYYDNCGKNLSITNGFLIRTIDSLSQDTLEIDKYPIMSFKDLIESLNAIHGVGFGYEVSLLGDDVLRVEPYDYFYGEEEVFDLTNYIIPSTYSEEIAGDLIPNEIVVGYNKFPTDNNYGLDEFNTSHTIQTPIKYHTNSFEKRSPFIASGYLIEYVRRQAYKTGETKVSTDYDEDIFVVCTKGTSSASNINDVQASFRVPYQYILDELGVQQPLDPGNFFYIEDGHTIIAGSTISVTGSVFNNKSFTVVSVIQISVDGVNKIGIYVSETVVQEFNVVIDIAFTTLPLISEKDEDFNIEANSLVSPSTAYNLRINPKYMLLQHSKLINSGLFYKASSDKLKTTKAINNSSLKIQRKLSETCISNDPDYRLYGMKDELQLGNFNNREAFFIPEYVKVQAILQPEQIKHIINCHRGLDLFGKNYGYLTLKNQNGEILQCYLNELNILENNVECKVEFSLIKKKT